MRLSTATAHALPASVARPDYDRDAQAVGIVHFGIGAFHRAHQAVYSDAAMNGGDRDWAVAGVSLRSPSVGDQLNPQDGLYTVTAKGGSGEKTRLVGAVRNVLVGPDEREAVIEAIAAPATRILSFTITEKGYCRSADGSLDLQAADGHSIHAYLAEGLARRRAGGMTGVTLLSCDNLSNNGAVLSGLFSDYLDRHDAPLRRWFEAECACPSTMVDRIVPATTALDREVTAATLGLRDEATVVTEDFSQWVIEDRFAGPRPGWERVGVQFTGDVQAYETAKLRMLNGAHSALAYIGLAKGYIHVHDAMADREVAALAERLMRDEAAPTVAPAPGQDLDHYADELLARFRNAALPHRLIQIAMDGSQKIPQRWLETLAIHQARGQACPVILEALGAWVDHASGDRRPVDDPRAAELADLWRTEGRDGIVPALFGPGGVFSAYWTASELDLQAISRSCNRHR